MKGKRLGLLCGVVCLCLAVCGGCGRGTTVVPGYAEGELRCSFSGQMSGIEVAGELWVSARGAGENQGVGEPGGADGNKTNGVQSGGGTAKSTLSGGDAASGTLSGGAAANGTLSGGAAASGTLLGGGAANGTLSGGGTANGTLSGGDAASGTLSGGGADGEKAQVLVDLAPGRDIILYFTAPAALSGLEISRLGGRLSVKLGNVELGAAFEDGIFGVPGSGGAESYGLLAMVAVLFPADMSCEVTPIPGAGQMSIRYRAVPGAEVIVGRDGQVAEVRWGEDSELRIG